MNVKRILFPTDFSPFSDAALHFASSLAAESGACLYIAHVEEDLAAYPPTVSGYGYIPPPIETDQAIEEQLNKIRPKDPSIQVEHRFLKGVPAESILQCAKDEEIDLIVMGTHGRTGLSRLLMGSVAEEVVRRADCPVLTLKHPVEETEEAHAN